jgi:hypothetical protein
VAVGCGGAGASTPVATNEVEMAKSYRDAVFEATRAKRGDSLHWALVVGEQAL